jgi:hypothetical protein
MSLKGNRVTFGFKKALDMDCWDYTPNVPSNVPFLGPYIPVVLVYRQRLGWGCQQPGTLDVGADTLALGPEGPRLLERPALPRPQDLDGEVVGPALKDVLGVQPSEEGEPADRPPSAHALRRYQLDRFMGHVPKLPLRRIRCQGYQRLLLPP